MKIYNTLTKKKDNLEPKDKKRLNFFVCGPTVYDFSHLGHARTYVSFDAFVKYLRKEKFDVFYLQNITDIDDKIIKRGKEKEKTAKEIAQKYEEEYLKDMEVLGVSAVSSYARATDHIEDIIRQTKSLLEKGYAYKTKEGIYYDISKFKNYGKLSGRTTQQAEDGTSRIDEGVEKKNKGDFCIWKFSTNNDQYEPKWNSPWGEGRPGWHIEDTAITEKFFGPQYDLHGGGRDLMFPHHEAEITIMEAISEKAPLVNYWMHTGFLTVGGEKMSKSLNNFITIREFIEEHSPRVLRFLILRSHYRSPFDYNKENINQSYEELKKIDRFLSNLKPSSENTPASDVEKIIEKYSQKITAALDDDFNTPMATANIFSLISEINTKIDSLSLKNIENIHSFLKNIDEFFGFIYAREGDVLFNYEENIPEEIKSLIIQREDARKRKDFPEADRLREEISRRGYLVEDTKKGCKINKIS
jgi:cysteinyl-tRNA synthetase